jgi:hypothetical protein
MGTKINLVLTLITETGVGEMFLQVFGFFFKHFNIDVVNILI